MRRAEEQAGGDHSPPPACELCDGTGWLTFEDPIMGGLVDAACPDCQETGDAD